jgi:fructose-bisphosphate aldolase class II
MTAPLVSSRAGRPPGRCHCEKRSDDAISSRLAAPVVIVHSLTHAIAALSAAARAGRPVVLSSAPDAGAYAGPGWFAALVAAACETVPDAGCSALLDCGDNVGAALAAIRAGVEGVVFTGRQDVARRLADIARQHRVRFETERPATALDLAEDFFASEEDVERRCAEFLG